jgi:AAA domain
MSAEFLEMTGREYAAYLETLMLEAEPRFKVISARELVQGRPSTPEEIAHDAEIDAQSALKWLEEDDAEDARERPNRVLTADKFAGTLAPREWVVKGIQPLGAEICVVYGDSGVGKSFFMTDMLTDVHLGRPTCNGRKVKQQRVVRLVAEGANDDRYRCHATAAAKGVTLAQLPKVITNAPDLFNAKQAADVAQQIKADGGCDILLIDTLSATFSGDENGSDMGLYIRHVKLIQRELKCTIWVVAHSGKDPSRGIRGWSGIRAAADVELEVTSDGLTSCVRCTKQKGGPAGGQIGFKLPQVPLGRDADGDEYGSCRVEYTNVVPTANVRQKPNGRHQVCVFQELQKLAPTGTCHSDDLIDAVLNRYGATPGSSEARTLKKNVHRSLEELFTKNLVFAHGEGHVSLTSLVTKGAGEDF